MPSVMVSALMNVPAAAPLVITSNSPLPSATVGAAYSYLPTATGGIAPYTWSLFSATPNTGAWIHVNASTGMITGTPTTGETETLVLQVVDSVGTITQKTFTLVVVSNPPVISTGSPLPAGVKSQAYSTTIAATGGVTPYVWSIVSATPNSGGWIVINASTGVISGTPSVAEVETIVVQVTDANSNTAQKTFSLTVSAPAITTATPLPTATQGSAYSTTIVATGGATPYVWSITSATPNTGSWISINSSTGVISGTPGTAETETVVVKVTDNAGNTSSKTFTLVVNPSGGVFGVKVSGGKLVSTLTGAAMQLRGVNISGLQGNYGGSTTPINPQNTSGVAPNGTVQTYLAGADLGTYPWWTYLQNFKANVVRLPLNEATYLRTYTGQDISNLGPTILPDNANSTESGQYRAVIKKLVADLNAINILVILDLHWTSPGPYISGGSNGQVQAPDTDHSPAFWTQLAADFGSNPGVLFELFNEYYQGGGGNQETAFKNLLNGQSFANISYNSGTQTITYAWTATGYQALLTAVRNAGATNVCICGGGSAAVDLSGYSAAGGVTGGPYFPTDPLGNTCAAWHSYGVGSATSTVTNASGGGSINPTTQANNCIAAGIPVICTECGSGDSGSADYMPTWADAQAKGTAHALIWTYDNWPSAITGNAPPVATSWAATFMSWMTNHT